MTDILLLDTDAEILQFHYYLKNHSHSMDAFAFNRAESELLKTIEEISKIFGVQIIVETEALGEGGVRANYRFKAKKNSQTITKEIKAILIGVTISVFGSLIEKKLNTDPKTEAINNEKTRLEIIHLKNQIKMDSVELNKIEGNAEEGVLIEKEKLQLDTARIDSIAQFISNRNKIKMHRSNFYKAIKEDEKITKVSTITLDQEHRPISDEKTVVRADFGTFIINDNRIEDLYEENVYVEVIAPVLNGAGLKWKGSYKGNPITFSMQDKLFRDYIISKNLKFSNGVKLLCDMEIKRSMKKDGDVIFGAKNVYNVTEMKYPNGERVDILHT